MKYRINLILLLISSIILTESLHYLELVKLRMNLQVVANNSDYLYYIHYQILAYFLNIITFIMLALYVKFIKKENIYMTKLVFCLLIFGNILYKLTIYKDNTLFYYLSLISQIMLLIYLAIMRLRNEK